ncbi:hypothetical protein BDA99DRAFT_561517 [Phascolomyces articulosus]|uniref:Uncharacterized protein n=1 Tax=Phascolomyces articulosus TaxID=60185 RepID=A0AAD5JWW7_9FUNG|nr:hypothetical protein BDA99DRAFT_561517 [Phascolomyces articulosus]
MSTINPSVDGQGRREYLDQDGNNTPFLSPPPQYASSTTSSTAFHFPSVRQQQRRQNNLQEIGHIAILPILNVLATAALVGALIYVYMTADGKEVDYRMAGMPIEALISLLQTLIKMLLAGGIGYAVSEFKWIQLERGAKLSLLDVYDSVTRGFGGMIRVGAGIRPDLIIIPAILLQLGLIAIGPSSQQILTAYPSTYCDNSGQYRYTDITNENIASWNRDDHDVRSLAGTNANYLIQMAIDGTGYSWNLPVNNNCPSNAKNCTIPRMPMIHNEVECKLGSFNETMVVSEQDLSIKTLQQYYNYTDGNDFMTRPQAPQFLYGATMQHRTAYDIGNFSQTTEEQDISTSPTNVTSGGGPGTVYAGEHVFVVVSRLGTTEVQRIDQPEDIRVHECKLTATINITEITLEERSFRTRTVETIPIDMNYPLLSDASHWYRPEEQYSEQDRTMINAYAIQVGALNYLITQNQDEFNTRTTRSWDSHRDEMLGNAIEDFINDIIKRISRGITMGRPAGVSPIDAVVCFQLPTQYHLDPASYYTFCLCLLIPVFWWVLTWIMALYRAGGISRGNSQVILLVTGFTAALRKEFKGLSHQGSNVIFERAQKTDVKFGELTTEHARKKGHVSFGRPDQISPLVQTSATRREEEGNP